MPRRKPLDLTRDTSEPKQKDEKQTKVDEEFINKKLHSLCSKPRKFQFYNINLGNYDLRLEDDATKLSHPLDNHRYESDETLGNFLVRAALQCEKNREQYQDQLKQAEGAEEEGAKNKAQAKRELHNLHCREKTCKHQLQAHVSSFYHKDGFLDI